MRYCPSKWYGGFRSPRKIGLLTLVAFSLFLPRIGFSLNGLTVKFTNQNPDYQLANVYLLFGGTSDPALLAGQIIGGNTLQLGTSYSFADLQKGIQLTRFIGGRICIGLGKPFRSPNSLNGNSPNFNNPSLPDFNLRWDKAEITYDVNNPHSVINLTATDFIGVRLMIRTYKAGALVDTLTWRTPIATVFHDTGVLSGFSRDAVFTDNETGVPTKGLTPDSMFKVVRVIAPSTVGAAVVNPYPSFQKYIEHVQANAITTKIEGEFVGQPHAKYNFIARINSAGALEMTGTITTNSVPQSHVLIISSAHLLRGIFTVDPICNIDGVDKHPGNTPFGAAVRDILSGFNFGFIGSDEQNPNVPGLTIGQSASYQWQKLPIKSAFAGAQPNRPFYNQYVAVLVPLTDAYGFPYSDLVQKPLAGLNQIDTLEITVLPD